MHTTTKGALAAGAAAVLLLGGAGSLAFWSSTDSVDAGSFNAGRLTLTGTGCDADWTYASGASAGAKVSNIVPGDAITKNCTFTVGALGDHLRAAPTLPTTVTLASPSPAPTTLSLPVSATYDVAGTTINSGSFITEKNDGQKLTAHITVKFPYGSATVNGNDTQKLAAKLNSLQVTLTQQQYDANPEA